MKITWFGHSCFLFTDRGGRTLLTDPFDPKGGGGMLSYKFPEVSADYVMVSHKHFDHNAVSLVMGNPAVIDKSGVFNYPGIFGKGIEGTHDDNNGAARGKIIIFVWEMEGLKICHLGDIGQKTLTEEQAFSLQNIDVLLVPTGGLYTIGPNEAVTIIKQLQPKIVIPMHYKTPAIPSLHYEVDSFLNACQDFEAEIIQQNDNVIEITKQEIEKKNILKIVQLKY